MYTAIYIDEKQTDEYIYEVTLSFIGCDERTNKTITVECNSYPYKNINRFINGMFLSATPVIFYKNKQIMEITTRYSIRDISFSYNCEIIDFNINRVNMLYIDLGFNIKTTPKKGKQLLEIFRKICIVPIYFSTGELKDIYKDIK